MIKFYYYIVMVNADSIPYAVLTAIGFMILPYFLIFKRKEEFYFGLFLLNNTLLQLDYLLIEFNLSLYIPHTLFITGPLFFLYIRVKTETSKSKLRTMLNFIPFAGYILFIMTAGHIFQGKMGLPDLETVKFWVVILGSLVNLLYQISALILLTRKRKQLLEKKLSKIIWVFWITFIATTSPIYFILDKVLEKAGLQNASDLFSFFSGINETAFIMIPAIFVIFYQTIFTSKEKYQGSRIENNEMEKYYKTISDIIVKKKYFLDENLTVGKLAKKTGISSNTISQIINRNNQNFNKYLNEFRIDYFKQLLAENPEKTILETALESGFNSKSSFNSAFKHVTGTTPGEYRKTLREKESNLNITKS